GLRETGRRGRVDPGRKDQVVAAIRAEPTRDLSDSVPIGPVQDERLRLERLLPRREEEPVDVRHDRRVLATRRRRTRDDERYPGTCCRGFARASAGPPGETHGERKGRGERNGERGDETTTPSRADRLGASRGDGRGRGQLRLMPDDLSGELLQLGAGLDSQ